jgi:hypothetical protein
MSDPNNNKDFKAVVLDPKLQPAKPIDTDGNKVTPPAEALPEAKPEVEKVA